MDEELKKEIEELKKEEKKKEEASDEEKSQEDLSEEPKKEPTKKVEEKDLKESRFKKRFKSLNFYLKLFGIILAFLGIAAGIFVLNKLLSKTNSKLVKKQIKQTKETDSSLKKKEVKIYTEKEGVSVVKLPTSKGKEKNKKTYYYRVTIFPFIMSISEKSFLKVEVTLFYSNYQETVLCRKNLFWYKEFFYTFLQKIPPDVWYNRNKIEKISKEAIRSLKRANITPIPVKIKIDGAILKA